MKNEIVRLECIDITVEGQGICKKDGLVIFVKDMIPNEVADVKIIAIKKKIAYGLIDKLVVSSPYRIKSICPISYKCGGCDFHYVAYPFQLKLKKQILISTYKNANIDILVHDVMACDYPYFYRNKTQIPVKNHQFGFYRKHSNDIVTFSKCYVQTELSNAIYNDLKNILLQERIDDYFRHIVIKHAQGTNQIMIGFIVKDFNISRINKVIKLITNKYPQIKSIILNLNKRNDNVILGDAEKTLYGENFIMDTFDGLKFKISLKSFYQINYYQMQKLYALVKKIADINNENKLLDLFSGIGTISLYMARYCKEVSGVEIVKEAVANANDNAKINNIKNVKFYLDDANCDLTKYLFDKDILIVDPPRKGLDKKLIDSIIKTGIKKIIYISCNPATQARDLNYFKAYYDFNEVYPVDMFPFTVHVETVVLMSRIEGK